MKLPKLLTKKIPNPISFFKWMAFNPITIAKNIIKAKEINREKFLLKEYETGRILQVDNDEDNKKFLLNLETA